MSIKLQVIVAVLIVLALLVMVNLVRKKRLDLKYALGWFVVSGVILIFDIFPQLLEWVTRLMGIGLAVNMLFFLGFVFSLLLIFGLTMSVSRLSDKVKKLSQEMALLEEKLSRETALLGDKLRNEG